MKNILILLALCATTAHAEFRDGNKLLSELNETTPYSRGLAMGYVMGVTDSGFGTNHCPPGSVTAGQVSDMVRNNLQDVPAVRHLNADSIIFYVLNKAWPCAKKGTGV